MSISRNLLPEIMHELIEKIVVYAPEKSSGHRTQQIDIYYRFDVAVSTAVADSMKYDKKKGCVTKAVTQPYLQIIKTSLRVPVLSESFLVILPL